MEVRGERWGLNTCSAAWQLGSPRSRMAPSSWLEAAAAGKNISTGGRPQLSKYRESQSRARNLGQGAAVQVVAEQPAGGAPSRPATSVRNSMKRAAKLPAPDAFAQTADG